jgi:hypothetical protein
MYSSFWNLLKERISCHWGGGLPKKIYRKKQKKEKIKGNERTRVWKKISTMVD